MVKRLLILSLLLPALLAWPGSRKAPKYSQTDDREITPEELSVLEQELPPEVLNVKPAKAIPSEDDESTLFAKKTKEVLNAPPADTVMNQLEKEMSDFIPEKMLSMDLSAKSDEVFLQDNPEGGKLQFRGAYFAGSDRESEKAVIDFFILDPSRKVIFNRRKQSEGLFSVNATKAGQYSFIFSNLKSRQDKLLTVAFEVRDLDHLSQIAEQGTEELKQETEVQQQQWGEDYLKDQEVVDLMQTFQKVQMELVSMQSEQRLSMTRQDTHNSFVNRNNQYSWWTALVEGLLFLLFAGFQVWYIMNMLENKRLLL